MSPDVDHLANLRQEIGHLDALDLDPDVEVPTCPGWNTRQLVVHLGSVHRWMASCLRNDGDDLPRYPDERPPAEGSAMRRWLVEGARDFVDTAADMDGGVVRQSWAGGRPVSWFRRRVDLETVVHRWDLENATGTAHDVPVGIAEDGIEEWLELAQGRTDPGPTGTIHLHGTDSGDGGEWVIEAGRPLTWTHDHAKGDVAVRAPLGRIFLAMWGRVEPDQIEHFGEIDVFRSLLGE